MNLEERALGLRLDPEVKEMIRTVFERALERSGDAVDHVRVRLVSEHDGVVCRARLWPSRGPTVVVSEKRASMIDAVRASAGGLDRELSRRRASRRARAERQPDAPERTDAPEVSS